MKITEKTTQAKYLVFSGIFLSMLLLNMLTPMIADDYLYSVNNGIADIIKRLIEQYHTQNGRIVAHLFARVFLSLPKFLFNICNAAVFCVLIYLICLIARKEAEQIRITDILFTFFLILLFVPNFGQTVLWEDGSANYLWMTTIIMGLICWLTTRDHRKKAKTTEFFLIPLLALCSGWSNENTGGAVILFILLFLLIQLLNKQRITLLQILSLIFSSLGFLILLLAPGNAVRIQHFASTGSVSYRIYEKLYEIGTVFFQGQLWLWVMLAVFVFLLMAEKNNKRITESLILAFCGIAACGAMFLSPTNAKFDRSMFGSTVFVISSVMILFSEISLSKAGKQICSLLLPALSVFVFAAYYSAFLQNAFIGYQTYKRDKYIKEQTAAGNLNVTVPFLNRFYVDSYCAYYQLEDISRDRDHWINGSYCDVYQLESIQGTEEERWNLIYRDGDPELMNIRNIKDYLNRIMLDDDLICFITGNATKSTLPIYQEVFLNYGISINDNHFVIYKEPEFLRVECGEVFAELNVWVLDGDNQAFLSSNDSASFSDIIINGTEYTSNYGDVTIVVYRISAATVVDSISWIGTDVNSTTR